MEFVVKINHAINSIVWGPVALVALLLIGIFFSFRLGFLQITKFKLWWKETIGSLFPTKINPPKKAK